MEHSVAADGLVHILEGEDGWLRSRVAQVTGNCGLTRWDFVFRDDSVTDKARVTPIYENVGSYARKIQVTLEFGIFE